MANLRDEAGLNPFRPRYAGPWIVVAMLAVSTAAIFIKLSGSHPVAIAFWRLLIAWLLILPFAVRDLRRDDTVMNWRMAGRLLVVGVCLALHFTMWIWSFQYTSVASSVLLVTTHPVFVALMAFFLFDERLKLVGVLGMLLALFGSAVVLGGDLTETGSSLTGNLLAVGGALMAGAYILAGRRFRRKVSLPVYALFVYGGAMAALLAFAVYLEAPIIVRDPVEYLIFGALALGPMLLGHTVMNWALKYVSPTVVSVSLLAEPIGSTALAYLILNEIPFTGALLGAPIVLLGIYLVARRGSIKTS